MVGDKRAAFILLLILFSIVTLIGLVNAQPSWVMWSHTYGGTGEEGMAANGVHLVRTSDGGFALAGGTYSFGAGGVDFWLVKTDANGNMEWNRTYGGADHDIPHSLIQTADGGFALCGETRLNLGHPDFWLVKTDKDGNMEWNKTYGGLDIDRANSLIQTSDGGYAIAGETLSFGAGEWDSWLVKTDANGNMEWNQTYGGADGDNAVSVVETSDGGYVLAGSTDSFGAGTINFWLVKTDGSGNMEWNQTYGESDRNRVFSMIKTSDGGFALAGDLHSHDAGVENFWLVKTDGSGNMEWNRTYGGANDDFANSVVQTSDGGYAIAGDTQSFGAGDHDLWLIKTNEQGLPEFPSWTPLLFTLMVLAVAVAIYKRRLRTTKGNMM